MALAYNSSTWEVEAIRSKLMVILKYKEFEAIL